MMDDSRDTRQALERQRAGLCAECAHAQVMENDRGSRFYLCRLSFADPRFVRYPRLPVIACGGHVPALQRS